MRISAAALSAGLALSGCAQPRPWSERAATPEPTPAALTPAPEVQPARAQVLGKDSQGCTWVASQAVVTVGEQDSRYQARAAAISQARQAAMQDFLGVEVSSRFLDFQQEGLRGQQSLTESLLQTTRLGRILKESVDAEGYRDLPGCAACRYHVALKTCLAPLPAGADRNFRVELGISRTRFTDGDKARLSFTASRDCYLYVYSVDMDWRTSVIVPNDAVPQAALKAGQTWEYPDEAAAHRGVSLMAQVPEGKSVSAETVRVVASRAPLPEGIWSPADGGYLGVLSRLNASRENWTEDAQAFTIYKQ